MINVLSKSANPTSLSDLASAERRNKNRPDGGYARAVTQTDINLIDGLPATEWHGKPDAIDRAAEREALALAKVGAQQPTLFERRREIPITRNCRYATLASVRAHAKIEAHYRARLSGQPSSYRFDSEICTTQDRARRERRKQRRKLLLDRLEQENAAYVPFSNACKLADLAGRTLQRQCLTGRVARVHRDGQVLVAVADLRCYLKAKCAA